MKNSLPELLFLNVFTDGRKVQELRNILENISEVINRRGNGSREKNLNLNDIFTQNGVIRDPTFPLLTPTSQQHEGPEVSPLTFECT